MPLFECEHVTKAFARRGSHIVAVDDVSFTLEGGITLGIIGESGSGKSTLGRIALGLIRPDSGRVVFKGTRLDSASRSELRALRREMQIVFQEPFESLNPRLPIGRAVAEPLEIQESLSRGEREKRVAAALEEAGLPASFATRYPSALSGGEQQRVGIARAMILRPSLIVLDEPTSSLDLSVQAGILRLLAELQEAHGLTYLFISHDIGTIEAMSDRILVMNGGRIVESGEAGELLAAPRELYTRELLSARLSHTPPEQVPA